MNPIPRPNPTSLRLPALVLGTVLLAGCSTIGGWFDRDASEATAPAARTASRSSDGRVTGTPFLSGSASPGCSSESAPSTGCGFCSSVAAPFFTVRRSEGWR